MAKQLIISVLEDVVGEYVLNVSKDNLKLAAMRGKVKLENVQLDGELIGSHVLGAVGLSGFGVLSCWAKAIKISAPMGNFEKEPARCELYGVHLVCVPLLPSTAHKHYGAGTANDPRCSLRTRAKRSALARFERNFFAGRVPGEGPPNRRIKVALRRAERALRTSKYHKEPKTTNMEADTEFENLNNVLSELDDNYFGGPEDNIPKDEIPEELLQPEQGWKGRIRDKVLRNLQFRCYDMHIRCEVAERGLEFSSATESPWERTAKSRLPADQRAFAFGFNIESMTMRADVEKDPTNRKEMDGSSSCATNQSDLLSSLSSAENCDYQDKFAQIKNASIYWDDEPPLLISETAALRKVNKLSPTKLQARVAAAMDAMASFQDPGLRTRLLLGNPELSATSPTRRSTSDGPSTPHHFCVESFNADFRVKLGDRNTPGPMRLIAEVLPTSMCLSLRPHQLIQYQTLKSAMLSQQRFDTMLRQRPRREPSDDPRLWWRYAISCVTSRPNSRPWVDVAVIVKSRTPYIQLVKKKLLNAAEGSGFHGGLDDQESDRLLHFEDLLPIEVLQAFHLLALREVYNIQKIHQSTVPSHSNSRPLPPPKPLKLRGRGAGGLQSLRKMIWRASKKNKSGSSESTKSEATRSSSENILENESTTREVLLHELSLRLGKKRWFTTFILNDAKIRVNLLRDNEGQELIICLEVGACGLVRTFGMEKREFAFDVLQCDVYDCLHSGSGFRPSADLGDKILMFDAQPPSERTGEHLRTPHVIPGNSALLSLPPPGVVCSISVSKDLGSLSLHISAHPATVVWNQQCIKAMSDFFSNPSSQLQTDVTRHLRNVATPLARKAVLALLSPSAISLKVNIAAPKLWFPVSSHSDDGAVFLDAGKVRLNCSKEEREIDVRWNVGIRDIQIKFDKSVQSTNSAAREISVLRPFHIKIGGNTLDSDSTQDLFSGTEPTSCALRVVDVIVSPICLNLVDAEILARAIGKWYAFGLGRVKKRARTGKASAGNILASDLADGSLRQIEAKQLAISNRISLSVSKVEIALEGHSRSTLYDVHPDKRTYLVEFFNIQFGRTTQSDTARTRLVVEDATITQIVDASLSPSKYSSASDDLKRCVLVRLERDEKFAGSDGHERKDHVVDRSPLKGWGPSHLSDVGFEPVWPTHSSSSNCQHRQFEKDIVAVNLFHDGIQHLDEVEIDAEAFIVRVTPTSLKDCAKGLKRILELVQLVTNEMERKVHEGGRKARQRQRIDQDSNSSLRPVTPTLTDFESDFPASQPSKATDSSILFKVTLRQIILQAGRPIQATEFDFSNASLQEVVNAAKSNAVVQLVTNALIMFQSIENPDGSGTKTLHLSLDNLAVKVMTEFAHLHASAASPMIGPTSAEFRIVYATANLGCVVSQDVSLDCEATTACMTLADVYVMVCVVQKMSQRLRSFELTKQRTDPFLYPEEIRSVGSKVRARRIRNFVRYKKKGTGIATSVKMEIQNFSVVLLQAYRSREGARPFFDIRMKETKATFDGCQSALSGEGHAVVAMKHYNFELGEWQDAVEETWLSLVVDQMPNELVLEVSANEQIQLNITGAMLKDAASLDLSIFWRVKASPYRDDVVMDAKSLESVGLRRAMESTTIFFENETGLDVLLSLPYSESEGGDPPVDIHCKAGVRIPLEGCVPANFGKRTSIFSSEVPALVLKLARSGIAEIGPRHALANLPIFSDSDQLAKLHKLQPAVPSPETSTFRFSRNGRHSPETVISETSAGETLNSAYYGAEPVVEWCMQNQRLRASIIDVYSLETGRDLLSSAIWSPEDEVNDEPDRSSLTESETLGSNEELELTANGKANSSPSRRVKPVTSTRPGRSNWVRPYLKDDSPEWTDMTCILRMARDRVMLPDNNWIWLNDWTVDLSAHEREADFDGWEYEADFETFNRNRRFYKRGDSCRRRRWTRTRMVRPPSLHDPYRPVSLVWETTRDEDGNQVLVARSSVTIHNDTGTCLSVFVSSPSWQEEYLGKVETEKKLRVPIHLACATFLRLGTLKSDTTGPQARSSASHFLTSKIVIVPTGHTASTLIRTSVTRSDGFDEDAETLHLLVNVASTRGIVDIHVQPILKVVNLLPCELQVQLSEVANSQSLSSHDLSRPCIGRNGKKVCLKDSLEIGIGKDGRSVRVDPSRKPHLSLRVPGYRWSPWHRIVNRRASSHTWQPSECEVDSQMRSASGETADHADESKTIIHFERHRGAGDPLAVIVSIEEGQCPKIRVYAQYWILDKTGFGCRFCDGFLDMMGTQPDLLTSRRSHLLGDESKYSAMQDDKSIRGHQWSMGMNGMSLFFSERERIALSIERGSSALSFDGEQGQIRSKWVSPLDISNVIPKTVFSVDEFAGSRRFELAVSVTVCPGEFSRSRLITLFPRYQIVNLLNTELLVAQDGCLGSFAAIGPRSSSPYHWKNNALPPKVRLGSASSGIAANEILWTNGCIQLDKVGITSLRLPKEEQKQSRPMVVQVEVRLATKEQSSAVTVVIWSTDEKSNPLYVLRNKTSRTILCRQPLHDDIGEVDENGRVLSDGVCGGEETNGKQSRSTDGNPFECGTEIGPILSALFGFEQGEEFVWVLGKECDVCFGFDDPEKPHILEWTCVREPGQGFQKKSRKSIIEVDAMGSSATHQLSRGSEIVCQIRAEHSTKVIEFEERGSRTNGLVADNLQSLHKRAKHYEDMIWSDLERASSDDMEDGEALALNIRVELPAISLSVINNATPNIHGREIMLAQFNWLVFEFAQNREGYHEVELLLTSLQVDNHVQKSIHPVLVFCPGLNRKEPLVHVSAVRRVQPHSSSLVFRYAAVRILEIEVYLDRRTVESIASFIEPIGKAIDVAKGNSCEWVSSITTDMARSFTGKDYRATKDIEAVVQTANSGRIYFEHLHLHPVRIGLTFTQEWMEWKSGGEGMMIFHFIRGMTSIANAPLKFTSFMVGNAFESPQSLVRIVATHYSSQLTKQIFGILGSLAILGAPADFISNVGSGVRDFFYEPINGMVHGPAQFLEGLEAGTQSLARGVFVGVVRGAANVTEVVNANLAGLTADSDFIDERKAHQRMLMDAMSRGVANRTIGDSLYLAGASVARGVRSGAVGIWEQPAMYASKHGPVGFVKGVGKALVGAIVKPVVGVGDAAVLVMNHVSDATSDKQVLPKIPKRLRRALPRFSAQKPCSVRIVPYDDRAAKAQKIVTGGESVDDIYVGHANLETHLIIASEECLWAIDRRSREPWCISWEEISHFGIRDSNKMRITVFSQTGLKSHVFHVLSEAELAEFYKLLVIQLGKMGNGTNELSELDSSMFNGGLENISRHGIPGIKARQSNHVFGSVNKSRKRLNSNIKDEIDVIEQCFARVKGLGSESTKFFQTLDDEAWTLIHSWGQVFSGLSSRRCIAAGIINGTGFDVQIKSSKLVEGGSPCYSIPTKEFDSEQGILRPGGAIIFFGWGVVPNLLQPGNVFMNIETNAFVSDLSDHKSRDTYAQALPDFQVGFLEKSYDESGWWAKYWILVRRAGW